MLSDPKSNLNSEEKFLLALCGLESSEGQKQEILQLMEEHIDWDRYLKLVNEHGIIALEAYNIRELGFSDRVPEGVMNVLDNARMKTLMRNTWQIQQWKEVNDILSAAGIKHVLLKGMALEHTVYRSLGLRQMTDTDILVKKDDALRAWNLLQQHGFIPEIIKSPLYKKIITEIGKHLPTLVKDGYAVEIHNRLFHEPEKNGKLNNAIDNAIGIDVEGTRAFVLKDDIHLEFLKDHLDYHLVSGGAQLRLFLDMELIKPGSAPPLPDGFLTKPDQSASRQQRKNAYRTAFFSVPKEIRFRYLAGDIFPSLQWMRKRHNCSTFKAFCLYPGRLGKLLWLFESQQIPL